MKVSTILLLAGILAFAQCIETQDHQLGGIDLRLHDINSQEHDLYLMDSATSGGNGGGAFRWVVSDKNLRLSNIDVRYGWYIDSLEVTFSDGSKTEKSPHFGGWGGGPGSFAIPSGQEVNKVDVRSGSYVDALKFYTTGGAVSPQFGGNGGSFKTVPIPEGYRIVGIFGRYGWYIDQLGFVLKKIECI